MMGTLKRLPFIVEWRRGVISNPQCDGTREYLRPSSAIWMRSDVTRRGLFSMNNRRKCDNGQNHRRGGRNACKDAGISLEGEQGVDQRRVVVRVPIIVMIMKG